MRLAIGSDERTCVTEAVVAELRRRGHELTLNMTGGVAEAADPAGNSWPAVARAVGEAVAGGAADEGILFCWTGTGVSIAANKVRGVRAALCDDAETARGARLWNDANVLCLSLRRTSEAMAKEIIEAWFDTSFIPNEEDNACLAQLASYEQRDSGNQKLETRNQKRDTRYEIRDTRNQKRDSRLEVRDTRYKVRE